MEMKGTQIYADTHGYENLYQDAEKLPFAVTPAKAGVQKTLKRLDSCLRRNDDICP
jgi:hypothetical protein